MYSPHVQSDVQLTRSLFLVTFIPKFKKLKPPSESIEYHTQMPHKHQCILLCGYLQRYCLHELNFTHIYRHFLFLEHHSKHLEVI